jgi:hypothetical protein
MTFAVHKYQLKAGRCEVDMPVVATILTAQWQDSHFGRGIALWAHVDTDCPIASRAFLVVATGEATPSPADCVYVATIQQPTTGLVWHVFEVDNG